ncbi:MAG: 30S ribosomal protein S9 [Candidatus Zixiibacteriota bacterium]|nr:MAG: 30S ribosomal protein S9 [candidate division Zixibacteria bacterium]HHI03434.1 30S ribosomal protein S9 [candidate division Zixibacteria bacterium]
MSETVFAATGRRKEAVARINLKVGGGKFLVNNKSLKDYVKRDTLVDLVNAPMVQTETIGKLDIICRVKGGGLSGQAGAIRLALSRALAELDADLHSTLRKNGFLTRDPRAVERKKYGQPKARKRFQYSKR